MKIFTHGGKCQWCQLPRIEQGFTQLGHTITSDPTEADLIYSNNPWWDDLVKLKEQGKISGKIIFNVLDIPLHILHEFDTKKLEKQAASADAITSISQFTSDMLEKHCGIPSEIIYQPVMPVSIANCGTYVTDSEKTRNRYKYAFIGRKYDSNKRIGIGVHALWLLGVKGEEVAMVGNESVQWGQNLGLLDIYDLRLLYHYADFVFCLGKIEGLNLPVIEAMSAGTIPIVCNDMTTRQELLPSDLFPEYDAVEPNASSVAMFIAQFQQDNTKKLEFKERLYKHYVNNLLEKFLPRTVAEKILTIYNSIK